MPWFKVDDGFHGHPKVDLLSPSSVGIWTLCGSHCAQYLTDGLVFARTVAKFGGTDENVRELLDAGLWLDNGDGTYQFKDWGEYQPVRSDVEAKREAARERMKRVRANSERTTDEVRSTPSRPVPSRPDPSSAPRRSPETRLPESWTPNEAHSKRAREKGLDLAREAEVFKLHAETHDRRAKNWNAAFTMWLSKAKPAPASQTTQLDYDAWNNYQPKYEQET